MANAAYTTLQVIPSIRGVGAALDKQLGSVGAIGKKAGQAIGDAMAKGIESKKSAVDAAAAKVATARTREADAAGKVRVAEEKLETLRKKGVDDAGRLADAEEKVASAKRNSELATSRTADAEKKLTTAKTNLKNASDQASRGLSDMDERANKLGGTFSGLGGKIKGIVPMLASTVGIAGLAGSFGAAISVGNNLTNNLNTMRAVADATDSQIAKVSQTARQLGNDVSLPATSATDATAAMVELAKGGFSVDQAMAGAKGTLQLAAAAQIDAAQAATIQSAALQAFGKDAAYAGQTSDILANAANQSSAEITDVAAALQQSGTVANQFGLTMGDTAGSIALLANAGIKGSDAGTLLKSALLALTDQGNPAQAAIKQLGLTVYDANGKFVGMSSLFGQLQTASKRMTDEQYQAATAVLFGSDAMRLSGVAAQQGQAGFDKMSKAMLQQGSASKTAAAQTEGLPGALERAKNASEELLLQLYDLIKAPLGSALDKVTTGLGFVGTALTNTTKFIGDHATAFKIAAGVITAIFLPQLTVLATTSIWAGGQAVKGWLMNSGGAVKAAITSNIASAKIIAGWVAMGAGAVLNAAKIAGGWVLTGAGAVGATAKTLAYAAASGVVRTATLAWTGVQWLLNAALNANPIGIAVVAIAALVGGIILAYKNSETFRRIVHAVWNGIKTAVSATVNWFTGTAWPAIKGFFNGIANVVKTVVGWVKDHWKLLVGIITGPIGMAVMLVITHFDKIKGAITTVKNWIVDRFNDVVGFVTGLPGKIGNAAKGMWDGIKESFKGVINWIIRAWNAIEFKIPSFKVFGKETPGFTLGLPKLKEFYAGGYTGNYGVNQIAGVVHGDEHVTRSESRRKMERNHPGTLDHINAFGELPGYREGGYVTPAGLEGKGTVQLGNISGPGITTDIQRSMWDAIRAALPDAVLASATRTVQTEGHADYHNAGKAIDFGGPQANFARVADYIAKNYPNSRELIHAPFNHNIKDGKDVGDGMSFYGASTMNGHRDHTHWAMESIVKPVGSAASVGDFDSPSPSDVTTGGGSSTYDYSQGSKDDRKAKYDKDVIDAKAKYDKDLADLKAKYHIGTKSAEITEARQGLTRRNIELDRAKRAEIAAAGGDKDAIKAINDRYKPQYDAIKTERENLTLQRIDQGNATAAEKAEYEKAKADLDAKFKQDKADRKDAYDKALKETKDGKSYPTTISGWAQLAASEFVGGQMSSMLGVLGISDNIPALDALSQAKSQIRVTDKSGKHLFGDFDAPSGPNAPTNDGKDSKPNSATMATNTPEGNIAAGDAGAKEAVWAEWAKHGWQTAGQWMDTLRLVNGESSWKVGASYSGPAKSDARGLFQFLSSTAAQYGYGDTAADQAVGGAKYIAARYKNPSAAWSFWQNPSDKSVSGGHWYEQGGWLQPGTDQRVHNGTGRPEAVLNAKQWVDMKDTADFVRNTRSRVPQQSAPQVTYNMHARDTEDLFIQAQRQERVRAAAKVSRW